MANKIQEKIANGNLELKVNEIKSKLKDIAKATLVTSVAVGFGLGLVYGGSQLLNKSPEEMYEGVPRVTQNPMREYVVKDGDGYSTIAQNFDSISTQDIMDAYNGNERAARPGDIIYTDGNEVLVYRNDELLNLSEPSNSPVQRTIENIVQEENNLQFTDNLQEYTVPENSGYGSWRVARELGISEDYVNTLLEDSVVMGGDRFLLVDDDYLALERNNQRYQIEINKK